MHSIVVGTVSNMILVQISSKKELEQSFNFDGWGGFFLFYSFSVELFKFLQYLFVCLCDGAFRQEVKVKMASNF